MNEKTVLVFDIYGYMAHFRCFYSNVTSLTYYFPPRNTIVGMLACILGFERDSYYELFSRERCDVGLAILTPLRKLMFSTNLLDTDQVSIRRLRGIPGKSGSGRTPTVVEFVFPTPPHRRFGYRVFVTHEQYDLLKELHNRLLSKRYAIQPALGPANCLVDLEHVYFGKLELLDPEGEEYPIVTVIRQDLIAEQGVRPTEGVKIMLEEKLPPDFTVGRMPAGQSKNYLFELGGKPIRIRVRDRVFRFQLDGKSLYGVFM